MFEKICNGRYSLTLDGSRYEVSNNHRHVNRMGTIKGKRNWVVFGPDNEYISSGHWLMSDAIKKCREYHAGKVVAAAAAAAPEPEPFSLGAWANRDDYNPWVESEHQIPPRNLSDPAYDAYSSPFGVSVCAVCYHHISEAGSCYTEGCEHNTAPLSRKAIVDAAIREDDDLILAVHSAPPTWARAHPVDGAFADDFGLMHGESLKDVSDAYDSGFGGGV